MTQPQPRPDWVVLGTPAGDGKFAVIASKDLNEAELGREVDYIEDWTGSRIRTPAVRNTLTVEMRTYTVVVADSYAEAFRTLFATWSPDADRQEIGAGQREIGPA